MRFVIDILHPAHVHFFRPFYHAMLAQGHEFLILSREKDVTVQLLDAYDMPHVVISRHRPGALRLFGELLTRVVRGLILARRFKPDYAVGLMGPSISVLGRLLAARTIVFYDNETSDRINRFVVRMVDAWWSPRAFRLDYGARHHRYDGYHELAYLHPARFTADPGIVRQAGIDPESTYFVLRFVAWESIHDGGEFGFSAADKRRLVTLLEEHGRVLVSSESALPADLQAYALRLSAEEIHHVLAFATLLVGESSTMASEAACLGTHAFFVSRSGRGVNDEQQERYGLVHNFHGGTAAAAIDHVQQLLASPDLKNDARLRCRKLLDECIDVTEFLIEYFTSDCVESGAAHKSVRGSEAGEDAAP